MTLAHEEKEKLTEPVTHKELLVARPIFEVNVGCPSVSSTPNPVEYWPNSPRAQVLAERFKKHIHMHISCV
ncbi:hypothetical protein CFP56_038054 [Quercus suber]|uniref:tRNA-dihydrouridine synthase n=1 Tax=Quercus suber TaxID=58331 RepID=A0AAW0LMM1_QUESU